MKNIEMPGGQKNEEEKLVNEIQEDIRKRFGGDSLGALKEYIMYPKENEEDLDDIDRGVNRLMRLQEVDDFFSNYRQRTSDKVIETAVKELGFDTYDIGDFDSQLSKWGRFNADIEGYEMHLKNYRERELPEASLQKEKDKLRNKRFKMLLAKSYDEELLPYIIELKLEDPLETFMKYEESFTDKIDWILVQTKKNLNKHFFRSDEGKSFLSEVEKMDELMKKLKRLSEYFGDDEKLKETMQKVQDSVEMYNRKIND